jgi:hypothetical protein
MTLGRCCGRVQLGGCCHGWIRINGLARTGAAVAPARRAGHALLLL